MATTRETTLKVRQWGILQRRFRRKVDGVYQSMTGVAVRCQIRDREGGALILDLEPYFSVNVNDDTALDLTVPGTVTGTLKSDGRWDIFLDDQYITGGPVDLQLAVSVP
jgi:hypothetical protein